MIPVYCDYVPEQLEIDRLYISKKFAVAIHLCPCGCKNEVVTPLGSGAWTYTDAAGVISLSPSCGNRTPCKSHYFITNGKVQWC